MEIKDFFKAYQEAAWNKDTKAMINLYDERITVFDMWDKGHLSGAPEWNKTIEHWLTSLGNEKVKVEFDLIKISQSVDVGFASALIRYSAIAIDGTVLRSMKNRISIGFSKIGTDWKVIHQHTSAPISSTNIAAILEI